MFDTVKVGKIIARKRKERNMTQLALADRLGVSFQAVSNWERGNSMPDISKLPELAELFECSIEELLGGGAPAAKVEQIVKEGADDLSLGDLAEVAPVLSPDLLDDAVQKASGRPDAADGGATEEEGGGDRRRGKSGGGRERGTRIRELAALAPFLSEERLSQLAEECLQEGCAMRELVPLAPFLGGETLGRLAERAAADGGEGIVSLAPFLSQETLGKLIAKNKIHGKRLVPLAPFLSGETLRDAALDALGRGEKIDKGLYPFLSEEIFGEILKAAGRKES